MVAHPVAAPQQGGLSDDLHSAASLADDAEGIKSDAHLAHQGYDWLTHLGQPGGQGAATGPPGEASGGLVEGDDMGDRHIARAGRAPGGGLTAADDATPAHQAANEARLHAAAAAAHRDQATRQAQAQAAAQPDTSFGGRGSVLGATGLPAAYHAAGQFERGTFHDLHRLANAALGAQQGVQNVGVAAAPYALAGMAGIGNWAQNVPWTHGHAPGWTPAPPRYVTDPNAYRPPAAATAAAAPQRAAPPVATPPPPNAPPQAHIAHHMQQAQAHVSAAQDIASQAGQRVQPDFVLNAGREQPLANTQPINVGDVSHLQGGFAPANLQPYHEDIFHRVGDWLGGHFGSTGQREAYDARGIDPNLGSAQSRAFAGPDQGAAYDSRGIDPSLGSAQSRAFAMAPPVQSEAFQTVQPLSQAVTHPDLAAAAPVPARDDRPVDLADAVRVDPQLGARGVFAWARRRPRQDGGDLSDPHNDDPYRPQGPGLNIPTSQTQTPKLAVAPAPGQSGGGLGSALGDTGSVAW